MNEGAYHAAALPEPFTILGLRLKPYSLGHHLLLHRIESPFVSGVTPTYDDLALAVLICSQRFSDAWAMITSPLIRPILRWFEWKVSGRLNPFRLFRRRVVDLAIETAAFNRYKFSGEHIPYYAADPQATSSMPLPFVHAVRVTLLEHTSMDDEKVLNRGWWLCVVDYHILKAQQGAIQLRDKEADDAAREVAELAEKMVADGRLKV
jgi:hypothetical protein